MTRILTVMFPAKSAFIGAKTVGPRQSEDVYKNKRKTQTHTQRSVSVNE